jgi:RNA polymerase sigma-70 factor, ECF subfamily
VRAKAINRDKAIPYQVPASQELPARLGAVLLVVYLIFNEGFSAETTGAELSLRRSVWADFCSACSRNPR